MPALDEKPTLRFPIGYRTQQATNAPAFTPPPLDGTVYPGEFIDWHLKWSELHPYTVIVGEEGEENDVVTWGEVARAVHRLARRITHAVPEGPANADGKPRTIAIISAAEPITYNTMILACMRAGFEPYPLSPRNSVAGLKHLIASMSVHHVIGSTGQAANASSALHQATAEVLSDLKNEQYTIDLIEEPHFWELYPRLVKWPYPAYDRDADIKATELMPPLSEIPSYRNADLKTWPAIVMHSSGSTGFPKPIRADQRMFRHWTDWPWYGRTDTGGLVFAALGVPSFHLGGLNLALGFPLTCGAIVTNFKPSVPAQAVNPQNSLHALRKADVDWFLAIPMFLELWSHDAPTLEFLTTRKAVLFGSAPLSYEIGERLVKTGVNLVNIYGATETGLVSVFTTDRSRDWLYTELATFFNYRLEPDDAIRKDVYRLVFEEAEDYLPSEFNIPGQKAYDIRDLVTPHPTNKHQFRILGRSDDQIIHSTGEKTNPGPLENLVLGSSLVKSAVYFGTERPQCGVIIEPMLPIDISDPEAIAAFRNAVWPHIERANKQAPAWSRVFKEYILVADVANKPVARTAKGSIERKSALRDYEAEIHKIYSAVEEYNNSEWARPPPIWNKESIHLFVSQVVQGTMRGDSDKTIDENRDLFEQGCDSLSATVIRNSVINALYKHEDYKGHTALSGNPLETIPQDLVYAYPTVARLSNFVLSLVHPGEKHVNGSGTALSPSDHVANMLALVEKYTEDFPTRTAKASAGDGGEYVLLTGTTGTLGTYLLAELVHSPHVTKIYAFNRPSTTGSLLARQTAALTDRGLDPQLAEHAKVVLLEGDASHAHLGLPSPVYAELRAELTSIIHAAWPLNFNMHVLSFEPYVAGSRNLVDLALGADKEVQVAFTSSLGSVVGWRGEGGVPERMGGVGEAVGTGYGESKWVVDQILARVSEERGLSTTSFRIGQLVGSTVNGAWNTTDWIPRIVQTGAKMGKLPLVDETHTVAWLPVDSAAKSMVEALLKPAPGNRVLSVVHPKPSTWNTVMRQMGTYLQKQSGAAIQYLPCSDWLSTLEQLSSSPSAASTYSALRLLAFLRGCISGEQKEGQEAMGLPSAETREMCKVSGTLAKLPVLTEEDVDRWMGYWAGSGLFGAGEGTKAVL